MNQYDPAFFLFTISTQVIATRQDYSYAVKNGTIAGLTTVPAKPGDVLILWGTGFGPATRRFVSGGDPGSGVAGEWSLANRRDVGSAALLNATPSPAGVILTVHN